MYKIGKTKTGFYTLWKIEELRFNTRDGSAYKTSSGHFYICSLGKKESTVLEKLKEYGIDKIEVDENYILPTKRSFYTNESEWISTLPEFVFPYGKLKGEDIRTCDDIYQLERSANKDNNKFAKERLLLLGDHAEYNEKLIKKSIVEVLKKGYIRIEPKRNISANWNGQKFLSTDEYGTISFDRRIDDKIKVMFYNGFEYYLPVIKGVGKKMKGKPCIIKIDNKLDEENNLIGLDFRLMTKKELELEKTMMMI